MRKVAIPVANNELSEHFGTCSYYEVFEIEGEQIKKKTFEIPFAAYEELPAWLASQGITDVIVYRVKKEIISLFASKKVNLFVGVPLNSTENIIDDYLNGKLESDKNIIKEITN